LADRSSNSTRRASSVPRPRRLRAAVNRLKPSTSTARSSCTHTTTGDIWPYRRSELAIARSASGTLNRYRR